MKTKLTWKKNYIFNLCSIYSDGQQVGKLNDKTFSQITNGELGGKAYTFKTKGFIWQRTEIIDDTENIIIGEILYNKWMTKATISIDNKTVSWKYDNLWHTKWSVFDSNGLKIQYSGFVTAGRIDSSTDDALYLLSGLFVINYYWQMVVFVLIVAFVPMFTALVR